jgi:hypothetical protein
MQTGEKQKKYNLKLLTWSIKIFFVCLVKKRTLKKLYHMHVHIVHVDLCVPDTPRHEWKSSTRF